MSFDIVHVANKSLSVKQEGDINGIPIGFTPSLGHSEIWRKKEGFGNARKLYYSTFDDKISFGDNLGNVTVLNCEDGSIDFKYALHTGVVSRAIYFSATKTIVSGGYDDRTVKLTNSTTGNPTWTFTGHTGPVNAVEISLINAFIFSCSDDGTIKRLSNGNEAWSYQTGSRVTDIRSFKAFIYAITASGEVVKLTHAGVLEEAIRGW